MLNNYPQTVDLEQGEILVGAYLANRYKHLYNADGGKLFITTQRLIFEPHAFNIDTRPEEIPLSAIESVGPFWAFIVPNGMKVILNDGSVYKYVVNRRGYIMKEIERMLPR
jgi:hypothetical protein